MPLVIAPTLTLADKTTTAKSRRERLSRLLNQYLKVLVAIRESPVKFRALIVSLVDARRDFDSSDHQQLGV